MTTTTSELESQVSGWLLKLPPGETVVLSNDGATVARITIEGRATASQRPIGLCRGEIEIAEDFDAPLPEDVLADFER